VAGKTNRTENHLTLEIPNKKPKSNQVFLGLMLLGLHLSGADRIRTCGPSFPDHRFSKPALSTTQPPLPIRFASLNFSQASQIVLNPLRKRNPRLADVGKAFFQPLQKR
tara:strand:+ start:1893 stop:2219 length:327 start_codon:yes stop_codon:yes gene_type:complete